jgi:acetate kinase
MRLPNIFFWLNDNRPQRRISLDFLKSGINNSAWHNPAPAPLKRKRGCRMSVLVLNTGSSSLKFTLFDFPGETILAAGQVAWQPEPRGVEAPGCRAAIGEILRQLREHLPGIQCVGHRVVHGGDVFRESARVDPQALSAIQKLCKSAPLHNPLALDAIFAVEAALPHMPQVAVFDTAFFNTLPPAAYVYPTPYEWLTRWGVRRFGFHGISHAWAVGRAAELAGAPAEFRVVTCHLGNGCSVTASRAGRAVATSMGFTPMEGLMMGTRSGSIDPGVLLHVMREHGLSADDLDTALNRQSGLLGVSGLSGDFREIERAMNAGHERAALAFAMYADRARSAVGGMAVTLGGLDALVFTGGVGENSARLRAAVCKGLECLQVRLSAGLNESSPVDCDIAAPDSQARIFVIRSREDLLIARECRRAGLKF